MFIFRHITILVMWRFFAYSEPCSHIIHQYFTGKGELMNQTFMKEKKILPLVLSMSLPMVLSMLVNSLYNIIDSYFVAKINENAMTALSLVYPLQILINAVAVGLGIGLNTAASFYLGAQNLEKADDAASLGMVLSVIHGLVLTFICILIVPSFLHLFTQDEAIISYALTYSYIVFAFTTPITISIAMEKVFQAEGQMVITMTTMLCGCITNIILDPIFIFGLGPVPEMGIAGAAWATGIGQIVPMVLYFIIYLKKPLPLRLRIRKGMFDRKLYGRIYGVGIPAALNMALPSLMITALNGILASFSAVYVLVLGIYYKLQTFIYLTANGIVQGIRPIVGYNYGAGEYKRVKNVFQTALVLTAGVMLAGAIICMIFASWLMGLFTSNLETISAGCTALRIISIGFLVSSISVTASGLLEGLGQGTLSLIISFMRYLLVIVPAAFLLSKAFGAVGVWHAFWIAEAVSAFTSYLIYRKKIDQGLLR